MTARRAPDRRPCATRHAGRLAIHAFVCWVALGAGLARADVDLTGSWQVTGSGGPATGMIVGQHGSSLGGVVDWPFVGRVLVQGTIDQTTGSFELAGSYRCSSGPPAADGVVLHFSGTAPGDGTFTGTVEARP